MFLRLTVTEKIRREYFLGSDFIYFYVNSVLTEVRMHIDVGLASKP